MAREEGGSHLIGNEGRINLPDLAKQARIVASPSHTHRTSHRRGARSCRLTGNAKGKQFWIGANGVFQVALGLAAI